MVNLIGKGPFTSPNNALVNTLVETRWKNVISLQKNPTPPKYLQSNVDTTFLWLVVCNAPSNKLKCKILEAYYVVSWKWSTKW